MKNIKKFIKSYALERKRIKFDFIAYACFLGLTLASCTTTIESLKPRDTENGNKLTVSVTGDIMMHDSQLAAAFQESCSCYQFENSFSEIAPYLQSTDLSIGNLETTLPGDKNLFKGYPNFGAPDSLADALESAGFNILVTANNHSADTGEKGVRGTIKVLDKKGIKHTGTFSSLAEYREKPFLFLRVKGYKIALLNFTYGTNGMEVPQNTAINLIEEELIKDQLLNVRKYRPDLTIVFYHFGKEYERVPNDYQKKFVEWAFQNGAQIVFGSHPHVLQKYDHYQSADYSGNDADGSPVDDRFVIYSLGNFISGQNGRYRDGGIILQLDINKRKNGTIEIDNIKYIPVWRYIEISSSGKRSFKLLPVEVYLDKEKSRELPESSVEELKTFYNDTKELYR